MVPRETAATAFRGLAVAYKQTPKANAIISQAVTPFHGALNIFFSIPGASPLRGFTPRYMLSPRLHGAFEFRSPSVRRTAPTNYQFSACERSGYSNCTTKRYRTRGVRPGGRLPAQSHSPGMKRRQSHRLSKGDLNQQHPEGERPPPQPSA